MRFLHMLQMHFGFPYSALIPTYDGHADGQMLKLQISHNIYHPLAPF